jgi:hypothetical protein
MTRRGVMWWMIAVALILAVIGVTVAVIALRFEPIVRARVVRVLEERYQSKVSLQRLSVSLFPRASVVGEGMELRYHGRTDVPPMITLRRFTVHAGIRDLMGTPVHVPYVRLEGLVLHLPPKEARAQTAVRSEASKPGSGLLVVDQIDADGTFLEILPKESGKSPLQFEISQLSLRSVGIGRPMEFQATLTNPEPPGLIRSSGHFGPWQSGEPGDTPVDGHYTFDNANLGVFSGIAGILSSTGDYKGQLNHIEVSGTTDIPDFRVSTSGYPVHLTTDFQAIVDGTNGDTYLQPVNARFLHTQLVCTGKVEHEPGQPGKTISLDVDVNRARIEDLLRLAVKGAPVMTGSARLRTKFVLPPGKADIMERLKLAGQFGVGGATFTSSAIQEKITDLSLRGQGRPKEAQETNVGPNAEEPETVVSNLNGGFALQHGTATLSHLSFAVPGAQIVLDGTYGLKSERLDFAGTFRMQAKVSEAFTGWKSALLKAVDPLFSKHGAGTEISIRIKGTREAPQFGLELFHRK